MSTDDPSSAVRAAVRADGEAILRLWLALLEEQAAFDAAYAPAPDAAERWRNDFPEWLGDPTRLVAVAVAGSTVVGFVTARAWSLPPIYRGGEEVHLDELYVHPPCRGGGCGRRLVETVAAWAADRGAGRIQLGVLAGNTAGRAFWERCGGHALAVTYALPVGPGAPSVRRARPGIGFRP